MDNLEATPARSRTALSAAGSIRSARVKGQDMIRSPKLDMRVSYEDMANPRRDGKVIEVRTTTWGTQYVVRFDDGEETYSDLRQHGWVVR
jgi:hypothetical protein